MKKIEVVAGIIVHDNLILCVQRGANKLPYISEKFEFPGGKIEKGESREEALKRELNEELEVECQEMKYYLTIQHVYPDFEITMHSYLCKAETKQITLTEHISAEWLRADELYKVDWAAADIPIVDKIITDE